MKKDNVVELSGLENHSDTVTERLRTGAQQLLQQAIEAELNTFLEQFENRRLDKGCAAVVRSGYLPERDLQTGIGPVNIKVPKVRSRDGEPVTFRSALVPPELVIGDGALGFWAAADQIYPDARQQRCWVHKTANVLNKLPKSAQPKAKQALHDIWMAETRKNAIAAFDLFIETYQDKYPAVAECLLKDQDELLAFYDFPAQHWQSIRTTNPIESSFATIRHRTKRSKGCLSRDTMLHMMFKLGQVAIDPV